jgi:hypothetical protein
LDLGPASAARARNRLPSGWLNAGDDKHYCPLCSPRMTMLAFAGQMGAGRPQPLL